MKKIILIFSVLFASQLQSQTVLTKGRLDTIWGTGQVPKGANLTNTWYTLYPNATTNSAPLFFVNAATTTSLSATYSASTLTLTSPLTVVDSYTISIGDSILFKNQTAQLQNGLYVCESSTVFTRCTSYDETAEIYPSQVNVLSGTVNGTKYFLQTTVDPVVGTNNIVYSSIATPAPTSNIYTTNGTFTGAAGSTRTVQMNNMNLTFIGSGRTFRVNQHDIQLNAGSIASSQIKLTTTKLGFYSTTPITKPVAVTTVQGLYTGLSNLGLVAAGTITSFSTNSITATASSIVPTMSYPSNTTNAASTAYVTSAIAAVPSLFTDAGAYTYLTSTTDLFQVGSSVAMNASFGVKGQGATAGTSNAKYTNSAGTVLLDLTDGGLLSFGYGNTNIDADPASTLIGYTSKALKNSVVVGKNIGTGQTGSSAGLNVFVGNEIANSAHSGGANNAIGYQCLNKITSLTNTNAIGYQCGLNLLTGSGGNFMGIQVGQNLTACTTSDLIGNQVAPSATTMTNIVAIGNQSANQATSGNNQGVSIGGFSSCGSTSTANTSVGYGAGYYVTTGNRNTLIGFSSDGVGSSTTSDRVGLGAYANPANSGSIVIGGHSASITNSTADAAIFAFRSASQSLFFNKNTNMVFNTQVDLTAGTHYEAAVTNAVTMFNGTAPTVNITNAFQLYSTGGVPAFRTAAGNITTLDGVVSAAVSVASTNKIKITVNGVDYYLLVTTVP